MKTRRLNLASLLLASSIAFTTIDSYAAVRAIALSGQPAPGFPAGTYFAQIDNASINDHGQIALYAAVRGPETGATLDTGVWLADAGSLHLISRGKDPAPGTTPGTILLDAGRFPVINDRGQVGLELVVEGPDVGEFGEGFWIGTPGALEKVAASGDQASGLQSGLRYIRPSSRILNDAGQTLFATEIEGPGTDFSNRFGVWLGGPGSIRLIARRGDPAVGMPLGTVFSLLPVIAPWSALNDAGQTVFRGKAVGADVDAESDSGIWFWNGNGLELVAREGQPAPGISFGNHWGGLSENASRFHPTLNNAGQMVFYGVLKGPDVDATNNAGVWMRDAGSINLLVRRGDHPPETEADIKFNGFGEVALNARGEIAFGASVVGPGVTDSNRQGIWAGTVDALRLVARSGEPAPGTSSGVVFGSVFSISRDITLNNRGQVTLIAELTGPGVDATNNLGIWAESVDHTLMLIARKGDLLEVTPGDFRVISFLYSYRSISGNEDGRFSTFNNHGYLAFPASFTDGSSGVFISDLVAVPEPGTGMLFGIALVCLAPRLTRSFFYSAVGRLSLFLATSAHTSGLYADRRAHYLG